MAPMLAFFCKHGVPITETQFVATYNWNDMSLKWHDLLGYTGASIAFIIDTYLNIMKNAGIDKLPNGHPDKKNKNFFYGHGDEYNYKPYDYSPEKYKIVKTRDGKICYKYIISENSRLSAYVEVMHQVKEMALKYPDHRAYFIRDGFAHYDVNYSYTHAIYGTRLILSDFVECEISGDSDDDYDSDHLCIYCGYDDDSD